MFLKDFNSDKLKSFLSFNRIYKDIKEMGLKKFWETNNKVFKYGGILLIILIVYGQFRNSGFYELVTQSPKGAFGYFFFSLLAFFTTIGFVVVWYVTKGFKDKYTTTEIMRKQMKYKGVDWHKFDHQLKNPEE